MPDVNRFELKFSLKVVYMATVVGYFVACACGNVYFFFAGAVTLNLK